MDDADATTTLSFRLLGPLEVLRDGTPVKIESKPMAQRLLAVLLLRAGRFVSIDELHDLLWRGNPPRKLTLQRYVSTLRGDLRPDGRLIEQRRDVGYRIAVDPAAVDVHEFRRLIKQGRASAERDPRQALDLLREALDLWHGDPPAGLSHWNLRQDYESARELANQLEEASEMAVAPAPGRRRVPHQLDEPPPNFAGRGRELAELDRCIDPAGPAGTTRVIVIDGQPGVGKTALALRWAARIAANYPDGQLSLNLRGFDPSGTPLRPETAARRVLVKLGMDERGLPHDQENLLDRYHDELAGLSLLLVFDNAASLEQVDALVRVSPTSLAVVTSRRRLDGLSVRYGARLVPVDRPDTDEAIDMLRSHLSGVEVDAAAAETIVAACGRLPLALAIAGARISRSSRDITSAIKSLTSGLTGFDTGDETTNLRAVLGWSYAQVSPNGQACFRALDRHPGPALTAAAASAVAGCGMVEAERALVELSKVRLIEESGAGRYAFLDLIRQFAIDRAWGDEADQQQAGVRRLFDLYLHSADRCATLMRPHRQPLPLDPPVEAVSAVDVAIEAEAIAWFDAELPVLRRLVTRAAEMGQPAYAWRLLATMVDYLDWRGHWSDWIELSEAALRSSEEIGDETGTVRCLRSLGRALTQVGRFDEAETRLRAAMEGYRAAGDVDGRLRLHHDLGHLFERQGFITAALDEATRCCDLADSEAIPQEKANALGGVAWCLLLLQRPAEAMARCEEAIAMHRAAGFAHGEAAAQHTLGRAQQALGRNDKALSSLELAVTLCQRAGDRPNEAMILDELAELRTASGDTAGALRARTAATAIRRELPDPAMPQPTDQKFVHAAGRKPGPPRGACTAVS